MFAQPMSFVGENTVWGLGLEQKFLEVETGQEGGKVDTRGWTPPARPRWRPGPSIFLGLPVLNLSGGWKAFLLVARAFTEGIFSTSSNSTPFLTVAISGPSSGPEAIDFPPLGLSRKWPLGKRGTQTLLSDALSPWQHPSWWPEEQT